MEELTQIRGRGRLFIGQLKISLLEVTYPGNSGQGGGNSGLGAKFLPPPIKFMSPLLRVAP
jgi:hypothetical protein